MKFMIKKITPVKHLKKNIGQLYHNGNSSLKIVIMGSGDAGSIHSDRIPIQNIFLDICKIVNNYYDLIPVTKHRFGSNKGMVSKSRQRLKQGTDDLFKHITETYPNLKEAMELGSEREKKYHKEYQKEWQSNNKDKVREYNKKWQSNNKDKVQGYNKTRRKKEERTETVFFKG